MDSQKVDSRVRSNEWPNNDTDQVNYAVERFFKEKEGHQLAACPNFALIRNLNRVIMNNGRIICSHWSKNQDHYLMVNWCKK